MFGWISDLVKYGKIKNKLKTILYDAKDASELKDGYREFVDFVDQIDLPNERKLDILDDSINEFKTKALELNLEKGIVELFSKK